MVKIRTALLTDESLTERYHRVRDVTERLASRLEPEDQVVQSMPDASPTRWHRAHTTWFFETFVLADASADHEPHVAEYHDLFNSYYQAVGEPFPRSQRGVLSRPTVAEVGAYRRAVDRRMIDLLEHGDEAATRRLAPRVVLGLNHEEQHQELILMDIKHAFSRNPLNPRYADAGESAVGAPRRLEFLPFDATTAEIGHGGPGFAYDHEGPRHRVTLVPFELADRLVTNGEFLEFIADGGYRRPELWLSLGFDAVAASGWSAPLYWREVAGEWREFTLRGEVRLDPHAPVTHVSYFEADAFARWAGARLPTEAEWEHAATGAGRVGTTLEDHAWHPRPAAAPAGSMAQAFGDCWEWTLSSYAPYPGYRPPEGAIGEYNGKFMCNQYVLRGGSHATPRGHIRATYRNYFAPDARWAFSGIRLARDVDDAGAR